LNALEEAAGPPTVVLPERLDRRLRFGPFPSARDGLKFVVYAAAGGVLAPFASPFLWLPIVAVGFAVAVAKPDGEAVDERALAFVLWRLRRRRDGVPMTARPDAPALRRGLLRRPGGGYYAVLRVGGSPLAYLPPAELERRFLLYRDLLRGLEGSLAWTARTVPLDGARVRPRPPAPGPRDAGAGSGYLELVEKLCARRNARRVEVVVGALGGDAEGLADLERRVARITEGLSGLGLRPLRLADRTLQRAGLELGLGSPGGPR
jgi:hypothetical protein